MSTRRSKRNRRARSIGLDVAGAEKKLRQARFFLGLLEQASAVPIRRAAQQNDTDLLEFYFSACLSAAQSVHYVLEETGGSTFKTTKRKWLAGLKDERDRPSFGQMIGLRDDDVHFAATGAEPLPKYVSEDRIPRDRSPYYQRPIHNAAIFGPAPVLEEKNPDGSTVTGSILCAAVGLYLTRPGRPVEVTEACRRFIEQLTSLVGAMKVAEGLGKEGA